MAGILTTYRNEPLKGCTVKSQNYRGSKPHFFSSLIDTVIYNENVITSDLTIAGHQQVYIHVTSGSRETSQQQWLNEKHVENK